jgi:hypothetical protein
MDREHPFSPVLAFCFPIFGDSCRAGSFFFLGRGARARMARFRLGRWRVEGGRLRVYTRVFWTVLGTRSENEGSWVPFLFPVFCSTRADEIAWPDGACWTGLYPSIVCMLMRVPAFSALAGNFFLLHLHLLFT